MGDLVPLLQTGIWAMLCVGVLIWLKGPLEERLKTGGSFKIGPVEFGALRRDVEEVQSAIHTLSKDVADLFLTTMSEPMYLNLCKIVSGNFGPYTKGAALTRELSVLRDFGYVNIHSIKEIPHEGQNLSDFVRPTAVGTGFVELCAKHGRPTLFV